MPNMWRLEYALHVAWIWHAGMHFDDLMGSKTWLRFRPAASLGKRSVEDLIEGAGQKVV